MEIEASMEIGDNSESGILDGVLGGSLPHDTPNLIMDTLMHNVHGQNPFQLLEFTAMIVRMMLVEF